MCSIKTFAPQSTNETSDTRSVEEQASRHVRHLIGFYAHLASFLAVNAMLIAINLLTSPGVFWAAWPILGWGVTVVAHAVAVFGMPGYADWKDRVRRRYIRRHANRLAFESSGKADDTAEEPEQLRRRVENLEAIVTSADWDLLVDLSDTDITGSASEKVAVLKQEVV